MDGDGADIKGAADVGGQRAAVPHVQQPTVCDVDHIGTAVAELSKRRRDGGRQPPGLGRPCPRVGCQERRGIQQPVAHGHQLLRAAVLTPGVPVQDRRTGKWGGCRPLGPTPLGDGPIVREPCVVSPPQLIWLQRRVIRHVV